MRIARICHVNPSTCSMPCHVQWGRDHNMTLIRYVTGVTVVMIMGLRSGWLRPAAGACRQRDVCMGVKFARDFLFR